LADLLVMRLAIHFYQGHQLIAKKYYTITIYTDSREQ